MPSKPYEHWLVVALSNRGFIQNPHGEWIQRPGYNGSEPVTAEQLRFLNEYFNRSHQRDQTTINSRLKYNWVENFREVVRVLCAEGDQAPWPFKSLFWIRLHEIVSELRTEVSNSLRIHADATGGHPAPEGSLMGLLTKVHDAVERIVPILSEDEWIYVDCRRHTECHMTQKSYDFRWSTRSSKLVDRHGVPVLNKEFSVAELDSAVGRVLQSYPNEAAIAVAFARRLCTAVELLVPPVLAFYGPT